MIYWLWYKNFQNPGWGCHDALFLKEHLKSSAKFAYGQKLFTFCGWTWIPYSSTVTSRLNSRCTPPPPLGKKEKRIYVNNSVTRIFFHLPIVVNKKIMSPRHTWKVKKPIRDSWYYLNTVEKFETLNGGYLHEIPKKSATTLSWYGNTNPFSR